MLNGKYKIYIKWNGFRLERNRHCAEVLVRKQSRGGRQRWQQRACIVHSINRVPSRAAAGGGGLQARGHIAERGPAVGAGGVTLAVDLLAQRAVQLLSMHMLHRGGCCAQCCGDSGVGAGVFRGQEGL